MTTDDQRRLENFDIALAARQGGKTELLHKVIRAEILDHQIRTACRATIDAMKQKAKGRGQ